MSPLQNQYNIINSKIHLLERMYIIVLMVCMKQICCTLYMHIHVIFFFLRKIMTLCHKSNLVIWSLHLFQNLIKVHSPTC